MRSHQSPAHIRRDDPQTDHGIYSVLPWVPYREKVEQIIREEMDAAARRKSICRPCSLGALAGVRALEILRQGAVAFQGPPQPGVLHRSHHEKSSRISFATSQDLSPAAAQPLPDPDEIP